MVKNFQIFIFLFVLLFSFASYGYCETPNLNNDTAKKNISVKNNSDSSFSKNYKSDDRIKLHTPKFLKEADEKDYFKFLMIILNFYWLAPALC